MQIRRLVTAETESDSAHIDITKIADTRLNSGTASIWGWDRLPTLPIRPRTDGRDDVPPGAFAEPGGLRVFLSVNHPANATPPGSLAELDFSGGHQVEHRSGEGMHRTDTVDLIVVLEGSITFTQPEEDGTEKEVTLEAGDVLVQNGAFHRWPADFDERCTMIFVVIPVSRLGGMVSPNE